MLSVIIGTNEYSLDDGTICRLLAYDGWGMAPGHRLSERGPQQHGETHRGYRLDSRLGTLVLGFESTELTDMYNKRDSLLALFKWAHTPKLKWALPNGVTRQIDVVYHSDMSMPWEAKQWAALKVAVTLKAFDPTFYDPTQVTLSLGLTGGGDGWDIPWGIAWAPGASTLNQTAIINYLGTFLTYPIIKIVGPITDPVITNEATNEKLDFTGISIATGDYYLIDTAYSIKTVVDKNGVNKFSELSDDSDLANFHIADDPEAPSGQNTIRVTGSGANPETQVYVSFYTRYNGL
jgi:hypothetical protein